MEARIETFAIAMQSVREWVLELASDERHARGEVLAATVALWVNALDDALEGRLGGEYHDARRSAGLEPLMLGARFARNAVAHGYAVVAAPRGLEYPIAYPIDYGPHVWAEEGGLHWDRGVKWAARDAAERAAYRTTFERRPLAEPLAEVADWLGQWQSVSS